VADGGAVDGVRQWRISAAPSVQTRRYAERKAVGSPITGFCDVAEPFGVPSLHYAGAGSPVISAAIVAAADRTMPTPAGCSGVLPWAPPHPVERVLRRMGHPEGAVERHQDPDTERGEAAV
jgi:hypothetical protein